MGLKKRAEFDHSQESVFEAAGYSEEMVNEEIEPRASLLANQLVHAALTDPMTAIDVLLESPALKDLDSRDRAIVVMMTGHFLAAAAFEQLRGPQGPPPDDPGAGSFVLRDASNHQGPTRIGRVEWDTLVNYVESRLLGDRPQKESEHIERIEEVLDDGALSPLQKAVVEVLVLKDAATEGKADS